MKLIKRLTNEEGYLLLENLVALMTITILLIVIYPLIVDWLVVKENAKVDLEFSRVLYESSMNWPDEIMNHSNYKIKSTSTSIMIENDNQGMGVQVYETHFK